MNRQIEILAPAGSYEGMLAAMNAGCDAVYIGGNSFGARAYANNLDQDTLMGAIDEAHIRGKKLYLTVNTLVKEHERSLLYGFLDKLYLHGLDAVIVQDVGVMHFIHRHFPDLQIHASTQTTITMAQGAELIKDMGVTRIVTPRELSLKEIRNIRDNTNLEIETFVHGALCYCYSGQCLMSSMIGGRSGNRGRCAQPCRMPYRFFSDNKQISEEQYLLSPKDICTVSMIPEMIEAGIDSFKIEGRMKRPEYAAAVTRVYRKYVDLYNSVGKEGFKKYINNAHGDYNQDMQELQDIYNRGGFSEGYLDTYNGKKMMSLSRPNHSGVLVGDVVNVKGNQVAIALKERIQGQDVLEIRNNEDVKFEFTVKDTKEIGEQLQVYVGRIPNRNDKGKNRIKSIQQLPVVGDMVYRTKNTKLLEQIADDYIHKNQSFGIVGKLKAKVGESLSLTIEYGIYSVTVHHDEVQQAMRQPMTEEKIVSQIRKTGNTIFNFTNVEVEMDDNIFVPVVWLNELRRDGIQSLISQVAKTYRRTNSIIYNEKDYSLDKKDLKPGIAVTVQTRQQLETALRYDEITAIYGDYEIFAGADNIKSIDKVKSYDKNFYMILPHICRHSAYETLKKDIFSLMDQKIDGFLVKNFETITLLQEIYGEQLKHKDILLNYNMYIYNREAKEFWREKGINHFTAPVELNSQELKKLQINDCDMIVYGYQPVMISAQCLFASTKGCKPCRNGETRNSYLTDRFQKNFYVQTHCNMCYNTIYNGQRLSLLNKLEEIKEMQPQNYRLDFTLENTHEMETVLDNFMVSFHGTGTGFPMDNVTTGHFKRGIE